MRSSVIVLIAVLLAGCRSVPEVFQTPQTDLAIENTINDIKSLEGAVSSLSEVVDDIKPGTVLTEEQVVIIKTSTESIKHGTKKAKEDIEAVKENHELDNKAASENVVNLIKEKQVNKKLIRVIMSLTAIIGIFCFIFYKIVKNRIKR